MERSAKPKADGEISATIRRLRTPMVYYYKEFVDESDEKQKIIIEGQSIIFRNPLHMQQSILNSGAKKSDEKGSASGASAGSSEHWPIKLGLGHLANDRFIPVPRISLVENKRDILRRQNIYDSSADDVK